MTYLRGRDYYLHLTKEKLRPREVKLLMSHQLVSSRDKIQPGDLAPICAPYSLSELQLQKVVSIINTP